MAGQRINGTEITIRGFGYCRPCLTYTSVSPNLVVSPGPSEDNKYLANTFRYTCALSPGCWYGCRLRSNIPLATPTNQRLGDLFGHQAAAKAVRSEKSWPTIDRSSGASRAQGVNIQCPPRPCISRTAQRYRSVPSALFCRKPWGHRAVARLFLFQGSHARLQADRQSADLQLGRPCPGIFWTNHNQDTRLGGFALSA